MKKRQQHTQQQYLQAMKLRGKYTRKTIAKKLGVHPWTMSNWFYQDLKPRCMSNKCKRWNKQVYTNLGKLSQRKSYVLPKISQSKELAYILGVYLGDGNDWNGFNLSAIDYDFVKKTRDYLYVLFKEKLKIRKVQKNTQYRVRLYSRQFRDYLIKKTEDKRNVPKEVFESSKEIKYAFFAGFFDSEGSVLYYKRTLYLSLSQKGKSLLLQFKKLLSSVGIHSTVYRDHKCYFKLRISNKQNIKSFYERQLFMKRKQNKLNKCWRDKYG